MTDMVTRGHEHDDNLRSRFLPWWAGLRGTEEQRKGNRGYIPHPMLRYSNPDVRETCLTRRNDQRESPGLSLGDIPLRLEPRQRWCGEP
jgi:hypothetical protein